MTSIAFIHKAGGSVVVFVNGKPHTVEPTAINYKLVVQAIESSDYDSLTQLLNIRKAIADYTNGLVEVYGSELYFDKKLVTGKLAERIISMLSQDMLIEPYVRFMEKVQRNPLDSAKEELFLFMESNNLPMTPDGDFLAYKYVRADYLDVYSGTFDNSVGQVIRMDRSEVDDDRNQTCSRGLHVCAFGYLGTQAQGRRLMVVKVNPENVVAIPSDYKNMKMRTCEYTVVDEILDWSDSIPDNYTEEYAEYDDESAYYYDDEEDNEELDEGLDEGFDEEDCTPSTPKTEKTGVVDFSTKLTADDVREIRRLLADEWSLAGIARHKKISARQVARIRDGESWSEVV